MLTKICTNCKVEKPITEYHKIKSGKYGVKAICKPCVILKYGNRRSIDNTVIEGEVWLPVIGFESYYEVSNMARVRSLPRLRNPFNRPTLYKGRVLKQVKHSAGYHNVILSIDSKHTTAYVHRLVADAFIPNPLKLPQVNHKNGIKDDNRIDNLEWVSSLGNVRHAIETGLSRYCFGERKPKAYFTNKQVLQIKSFPKSVSNMGILIIMGLDGYNKYLRQTVCKIRRGKKYKNVA